MKQRSALRLCARVSSIEEGNSLCGSLRISAIFALLLNAEIAEIRKEPQKNATASFCSFI